MRTHEVVNQFSESGFLGYIDWCPHARLGSLTMCPNPPDDSEAEQATTPPDDGLEPPLKHLQRPTRTIPARVGRPTQEMPSSGESEAVADGVSHQPDTPEGQVRDRKLIARTEDLADRAYDRLKSEVALPNVLEEAEGLARTVGAIRSPALAAVVGFYVVSASVGVAATAVEAIHDWFMHLAMYVVILSFLILYVKSHLLEKRLARALYAFSTAGLMVFFAWVLQDLVAARLVVVEAEAVERLPAQLLQVPAVMLLVAAAGLILHWLVLARYDARR